MGVWLVSLQNSCHTPGRDRQWPMQCCVNTNLCLPVLLQTAVYLHVHAEITILLCYDKWVWSIAIESLAARRMGKEGVGDSGSVTVRARESLSPPRQPLEYTVDDALERLGFGAFQGTLTLFCGFIWFAGAMELMLMSTLSFIIQCQWNLSSAEEAVMTSLLFVGCLIGSLFWGVFGDAFGRKMAIAGMEVLMVIFGVLSAIQLSSADKKIPGYPWLLLCRLGVGFASSCIPQVVTYYIEFLPRKSRAMWSVFVSGWWSVGTIASAGLAAVIMGETTLGWHWYLGLSVAPTIVVLALLPFFPETPRFYVVKEKYETAGKVLARIAWLNCKFLPEGRVVSQYTEASDNERSLVVGTNISFASGEDEKQPLLINTAVVSGKRHRFPKLALFFAEGKWRVTLLLLGIWVGTSVVYYGNILLSSTMLLDNTHCSPASEPAHSGNSTTNGTCNYGGLDTGSYLKIMYTASAEIPGTIATIVIIGLVGGKLTLAFNYTMLVAGFCLLFLCPGQAVLTVLLSFVRGFSNGSMRTMYVYTAEVYPTVIRGLSMGSFNSISRLGALSTPYIAQVVFSISSDATITVYAGISFLLLVTALLLPEIRSRDEKKSHIIKINS